MKLVRQQKHDYFAIAVAALFVVVAMAIGSRAYGQPPAEMPIGVPLPAWGLSDRSPQATGGVIRRGPGNYDTLSGVGTAERPIIVTQPAGAARMDRKLSIGGDGQASRYMIVDGGRYRHIEILGPAEWVVLRNVDIGGEPSADLMTPLVRGGGLSVGGSSTERAARNIIVIGCAVHDNGDWRAEFDDDVNGIRVGNHASNVWVLDCELTRNSGDGVSVYGSMAGTHHVYVARNVAHHNKQTGFWSKQASDVIFSENVARDHRPVGAHPSAWGAGMGFQYGPERVWFIGNDVYDCCFGIQAQSTSGEGTGTECYVVGNRFRNIRHDPAYPYSGGVWGNAAICLVGTPGKTVVHNWIWGCAGGIHVPASQRLDVSCNVVGPLAAGGLGRQLWAEGVEASAARVWSNIAWRADGLPLLRWQSREYLGWRALSVAEGVGSQNLNRRPDFADAAAGDWTRQPGSGVDAILGRHEVYQRFRELYGIEIHQRVIDRLGR